MKNVITMELAVKFGVVNSNNFKIEKEEFERMLETPIFKEKENNNVLFVYDRYRENLVYPLSDVVGLVHKIDLDSMTVELEVMNEVLTKEELLENYQIGCCYIKNNDDLREITSFNLVNKSLSCYNVKEVKNEANKPIYDIFNTEFNNYSDVMSIKEFIKDCGKYSVLPEYVRLIKMEWNDIYATTHPTIGRDDFVDLVNIFSNPNYSMEEFEKDLKVEPEFVKVLDNGDIYFGVHNEEFIYHKK